METQKRVVKEKLEYAGRQLQPGDEFECEVDHIELLLAFGKIEPKKGEAGYVEPRKDAGYKTRNLTARPA